MWSWLSVALTGYISISANKSNHIKQAALFKTVLFLMLLVMLWSHDKSITAASVGVSLGLVMSILSDSFYLFRRNTKLCFSGFIVVQLCYSAAFWGQFSGEIVWWLPAMLLGGAIVAVLLLLPKLDRVILPVIIMGSVLLQLNWAAGEVWLNRGSVASGVGFTGCLTLTLSAALLAIYDHKMLFDKDRYLISASYLLAHTLIAASLII